MVPGMDHNGPNFRYVVWWRRRDSREEWKNITTTYLKYVVTDTDTYIPYEIRVQAQNDFGLGPEGPIVIGYSGEDCEYHLNHLLVNVGGLRWEAVWPSGVR